jgi:spore maturation protein SpmA
LKKKNAAGYMNIKNALSPCTLGLKIMKSLQEIESSRALAKV